MENEGIMQILAAREERVARQKSLLETHKLPLICFTMNIAGPVKTGNDIEQGFAMGNSQLRAQLAGEGLSILAFEEHVSPAGYEAFYCVDGDAKRIKALTVQIEDGSALGRLFDMDVLTTDGSKLDRGTLGHPPRKCLLCPQDAVICSRSRSHSVEALREKTHQILREAICEEYSRRIGELAVKALLYEVCTTPKPGLVDCAGSGSHKDMDIFTFMASSSALWPYFRDCAAAGMKGKNTPPEDTFQYLRFLGKMAEQTMYRATGGVNTHKGAIFTLGLLCGAAGRAYEAGESSISALLEQCRAMTNGLVRKDLESGLLPATHGRKAFAEYGITGIRGEAEAGFPTVTEVGLPVLREGLAQGRSLNDAGCTVLLAIMAHTADTNLIARSDRNTQLEVSDQIRMLLQENPFPDEACLRELDAQFTERNLSPGGSADLLAATYFLHFLQTE